MSRNFKKCYGISVSICGGIVGAGFASGKEIVTFFARFGFISLFFCAVAGVLFALFSYFILIMQFNKNCKNDAKTCKNSIKRMDSSDKNMIYTIILFLCEFIICSAMFAAEEVLIDKICNNLFVKIFALFIIFIVAFVIVSRGRNVVHFVNALLTCAILVFLFLIVLIKFVTLKFDILENYHFSFLSFMMPILYVGMNILTVIPLLKEECEILHNRRDIILTSILIGCTIFIILFIICLLILLFGGKCLSSDMIMLDIICGTSPVLCYVYFFLIFLSVFTTLITTARGCVKCSRCLKNKKIEVLCVLFLSFLISNFGFGGIVNFIYPILGAVCIFYLLIIFVIDIIEKNCKINRK